MVQQQPGRVVRRLSAIVAADVAGYSRLMGLDEAGTARILREHRAVSDALVAKHGGRIVKTTGDGLLLEFPSVIDAVECAVAVQAVMAERNDGVPQDLQMLYRIGVNLGDILIEGDDILGDGVNIAARLESIAEPGGICISSSAYDQVRGKVAVEFSDLGEQSLKNITRPVRAYAVVRDELCIGTGVGNSTPNQSSAPHLSIVVLPFANIGGDAEQDYFVDGITECLTTDLSRIAGAFVIARNTLFDMQDEIVSRLANALGVQLVAAEARRAASTLHPSSMDAYFQGRANLNKGITPEFLAHAQSFFERAVALDPRNIDALCGAALVDISIGASFLTDERTARFAAAEAAATKALSLAPDNASAHFALGVTYILTNRADQGIAECKQALVIDPNLADAHSMMGLAKFYHGRAAETERHILDALRLSPRDIFAFRWMAFVGFSKLMLRDDEEAVAWLRRGIEANRNLPLAHFSLAAALALLGRLEEAGAATQAGLALDPNFTVRRFRSGATSNNPTFLAQRERYIEGMHLAGVPEG
jgi:class 3 adenylate cyclase/tetratricopeptide (TPR) repeat protein